jgi:hypothetical protein
MRYDWNRRLEPGTIICSNYNTFKGEQKVGIFMVLYDEQNDNNVTDNKNVVALKLSTKGTCVSNYSAQIDRSLNNFLDNDCLVCCSKVHVLHKVDQIYKVLGILHPATYHRVFKVYHKFTSAVEDQLVANI